MYAVTSMPLVSLTLATLRRAELGFLGVMVRTFRHTPRFCGLPFLPRVILFSIEFSVNRSAGVLGFFRDLLRRLRTSWLMVGTILSGRDNPRPYS